MTTGSSRFKGYIALLITSTVWGTTWVISKIGVQEMPALQMSSIRQLIAGSFLVGFFLIAKKFPLPTWPQFRWLTIMAILMFVSANGLSTWSIKFIPAGLGALIGALYPLSVVLIEKIFYKAKGMTVFTFIGLLLGIAGIAIVFYEHIVEKNQSGFLLGVFLSAVAMLSWSLGTIFIEKNKREINPYYGLGWQMLIGGSMLMIITESTGIAIPFNQISLKAWSVIAYLTIFGSLLTFTAFIYSMKQLSAPIASLYAYINPLVAMVMGHFMFDEKLSNYIFWGSLTTLAGVFLVNYSMKKQQVITEAEQ